MDAVALGAFVRARRDSLQPEDLGLNRGRRRRTAGLRREEVAALAGMSSDYLARIERGDAPQPSRQIIGALARALRLTIEERDHLLLEAGHLPPARSLPSDHVNPGLLRVLDSLRGVPAQVLGPTGDTLAQNRTAVALFGDETRYQGLARSAPYRWFTDPASRALYPTADHEHHSRVQVSLLQSAVARLGPRSAPATIVDELQAVSEEFTTLWRSGEIGVRHTEEKRFLHPEVGALQLYCQTTIDPDYFQTLLLFTATPGSESAEKLALLGVLGPLAIRADPVR